MFINSFGGFIIHFSIEWFDTFLCNIFPSILFKTSSSQDQKSFENKTDQKLSEKKD